MRAKAFNYLFLLFISFTSALCALEADLTDPPKNWTTYTSPMKHEPRFDEEDSRSFFTQWFTGPLLMPAPSTPSPQHPAIEPTVTIIDNYGSYDQDWRIKTAEPNTWTVNYLGYWQMGLTDHLGCEIVASLNSNYQKNVSYTHFLDTIFRFGYQVSRDQHKKGNWIPDFRFIFQETFPTGNYHKLNPRNSGLDSTGLGSYQSGVWLAAQKGFGWTSNHAFNLGLAVGYFIPTIVRVKGFSAYGGSHFTNGKVRAGDVVSVFLSGELELTKHLGLAFDSNYQQNFSGSFTGEMGNGAPVLLPQQVFFQLAPELEIIVTEKAGFIIGPWFTFAGQNTTAFVSFFVDFLYLF